MSDSKLAHYANELNTLIGGFIRVYNEADQEEKACCNLTISQCCTLLAFDESHEQLTMNELSSRLGLSTSTMTRHIDGLVRKEYVERASSTVDRRQVLVQLTEDGQQMASQLKCCEQNLSHKVLQAVPPDQWETVISAFKQLLNALNSISKQDCC